jgi:phage-related protein (TIGR01555 family)
MVRDIQQQKDLLGKVRGVTVSEARSDGWANALIGLGKRGSDKTMSTEYGELTYFTDIELSNLYMSEGLGKKIVDTYPKDAIRQWISIDNDEDGKIQAELKRLKAPQIFKKALSWARLYRGSLIVIVEKGVSDLKKPMTNTPKEIESLRVYSAARITVSSADIVTDPKSPYFEEIEFFRIRAKSQAEIKVHASRCLIFKGEESPDETGIDFKYEYWGIPVMMNIIDRLKNFGSVESSIVNLLLEFNVGKFTLANLAQMLSQNDADSMNLIMNRIDVINASKSIINSVLLGDGESYERDSANVSGVDALMDRLMITLAAVANYPVTKLFGRSPAGQNSTGESDIRNYYDEVRSYQETQIESNLQRLVNLIGSFYKIPDTVIEFNPLWQPTRKEQVETEKIEAETAEIYMRNQVVTPDEIRDTHFPELESSPGFSGMGEEEEEEDV